MGGFIKGIVVGVVSFGLGFAVLSVVLPPQEGAAPEAPVPAVSQATPEPVETAPIPEDAVDPEAQAAAERQAVEAAIEAEMARLQAEEEARLRAEAQAAAEANAAQEAADAQAEAERLAAEEAARLQAEQAETARLEAERQAEEAQAAAEAAQAEAEAERLAAEQAAAEEAARAEAERAAAEAAEQEAARLAAEEAERQAAEAARLAQEEAERAAQEAEAAQAQAAAEAARELAALEAAEPVEITPTEPTEDTAPATPEGDAEDQPTDTARIGEAPEAPVNATRTPGGEPLLGTTGGTLPRVQTLPSGSPDVAVRRGSGADAQLPGGQVAGVTVGRLPSINDTATAVPSDETTAPVRTEADPSEPALIRNAAIPSIRAGEAALGVIVTDAPEAETAILAFPVPVSVSMDPYDADAPRRAESYRAAGHEIILRAEGLPPRARPSDLEVIFEAWSRDFPQAVAVIDVPINGLGANAQLARDVSATMAAEGLGAIAMRNGLDAFLQAARVAGLRTLSIYRRLNDEEQSQPVIRRLIDRAAFEALRQPGVVIIGEAANRDTMTELADFVTGQGRGGVAIVPASTVLLDQ
ncbi:divergent polysaccharide deacetylase family protein [Pararhodobacter sp. CCB-MM2]|uniref:divergent polysaccharide deacetylase family protein n=1 Tax=Pararhodobacter sp. CCB-MM2 TaxID=1786003 RepID=UPI00082A7D18|nr:divergent polysaccharide deacetylase family protein [Pararhodobacter sp. CCB-MM2]